MAPLGSRSLARAGYASPPCRTPAARLGRGCGGTGRCRHCQRRRHRSGCQWHCPATRCHSDNRGFCSARSTKSGPVMLLLYTAWRRSVLVAAAGTTSNTAGVSPLVLAVAVRGALVLLQPVRARSRDLGPQFMAALPSCAKMLT